MLAAAPPTKLMPAPANQIEQATVESEAMLELESKERKTQDGMKSNTGSKHPPITASCGDQSVRPTDQRVARPRRHH